jgi:hypothetical protein
VTLALAIAARNAAVDAVVDLLDAGSGPATIDVRTGSKPATPATSATGTLLVTFTLNDPAYGSASSGSAALNVGTAITATGLAAGDAGWFRAKDSNGAVVFDGECGTSGKELNLNTVTVSVGLAMSITSGTYTQPQ